MATLTTGFSNTADFGAMIVSGEGVDFLDLEFFGGMIGVFAGSERVPDGSGQSTTHRTGAIDGGTFHAIGVLATESGSWTANGLILVVPFGEGAFALVARSTTGLTINPALTDSTVSGPINSAHFFESSLTSSLEYHFTGAITLSNTPDTNPTVSFKHIEVHLGRDLDTVPIYTDGSIDGSFTLNVGTGAVSGTITALSMMMNGTLLEASGFSINAAELFDAGTNELIADDVEFDTLFSHILKGADAVTGTTGNQELKGYDGNDTMNAGGNGATMNGGLGNDQYNLAGWTGTSIVDAGGIDTLRDFVTIILGEGLENLVLLGEDDISGYGNSLNNTMTGNAADNNLQGNGGADSMTGGDGYDTYWLDNIGDKVGLEAADNPYTEDEYEGGYDQVHSTVSHTLGANYEILTLGEGAAISGIGNALGNQIYGNSNSNILSGMGGDDALYAGDGNDVLTGGDGNDFIQADNGNDSIDGGAGNDYMDAGDGNNTALGGLGDDNINSGTGNDKIDGGAGSDQIQAANGDNTVIGGTGEDDITTGEGDSDITGGDGADYINAGPGANSVDGGAGNDEILALGSGNTLLGGAGDDSIGGSISSSSVDGGLGNDTITDESFSNSTLAGGAGNDIITSYSFTNVAIGGAGIDTVMMQVGEGTITLGADTENLVLLSVDSADGFGNALNNSMASSAGDDELDGFKGNDTYSIQSDDVVAEANDTLHGGTDLVIYSTTSLGLETYTLGGGLENLELNGNSMFGYGNTDNNVLSHGEGNVHFFYGLQGNDTYNVMSGDTATETNDSAFGTADLVKAFLGDGQSWTMGEGIENLTLFDVSGGIITGSGNFLNNVIIGAAAAGASNQLGGGLGNDTVTGGAGNDAIDGGEGTDVLAGGAGNDNLQGQLGLDKLDGGAGNDWLNGGGGNDGADTLVGGLGDDVIVRYLLSTVPGVVALLNDSMDGGAGSDTVYLERIDGDTMASTVSLSLAAPGFTTMENINASFGGPSNFNLTGNALNNDLQGSTGNDTLGGAAGNDTLNGGSAGTDSLVGGIGNDYYIQDGIDVVTEAAGAANGTVDIVEFTNTLLSTEGADHTFVVGQQVANTEGVLVNFAEISSVYGTGGADFLGSKGGLHTLVGGLGNDTYSIHGASDTAGTFFDVILGEDTATGGTDLVIALLSGGQNYTLGGGLENLTVIAAEPDSILQVHGNSLNNFITTAPGEAVENNFNAGDGNDTVIGGLGTDAVSGGIGNDKIDTGAGSDFLSGGAGLDTLIGGLGDDEYEVNLKAQALGVLEDVITDTGGHDKLDVIGNDTVTSFTYTLAAIEDFSLSGMNAAAITSITGNAADNAINGADSNDKIDGAGGNDEIYATAGNDTLLGGAGNDWLDGGNGNDFVDGGAGNDTLYGGWASDTLLGGAGDDELHGDLDGPNSLDGGLGNDTYFEQQGDDTYVVSEAGDFIAGGANGGTDTVLLKLITSQFAGEGPGDIDLNDNVGDFIENITWLGAGSVSIYARGDDPTNNVLKGGAGNDRLDGGEGMDTLVGNAGNDTLYGGFDQVPVEGEGYDDSLDGGLGHDKLDGGEGSDTLLGGDGNDWLAGGQSRYSSYAVTWILDGADSIEGGKGDDRLDGGEGGNDTLLGGDGNDVLYGGSDNDMGDSDDSMAGNVGNDTLDGGDGGDSMTGDAGNDSLLGGNGDDQMSGGDGNDKLDGGGGNDQLTGGAGNDTLDSGGEGDGQADALDGGAGNDLYLVWDSGESIQNEAAGIGAGFVDTVMFRGEGTFYTGANVENIVIGEGGADVWGNNLANVITGNAAGNQIYGGGGLDTVTGGGGGDTFVIGSGLASAANAMLIKDYDAYSDHDLIGLATTAFGLITAGGLTDDEFVNGTTATAAQAQMIYDFTAGKLYYDADGTGLGSDKILVASFDAATKPLELHAQHFEEYNDSI